MGVLIVFIGIVLAAIVIMVSDMYMKHNSNYRIMYKNGYFYPQKKTIIGENTPTWKPFKLSEKVDEISLEKDKLDIVRFISKSDAVDFINKQKQIEMDNKEIIVGYY